MKSYQHRMVRFMLASGAYQIIFIGLAVAGYLPPLEWVIFGTAVLFFYVLAVGFDAIYVSIKEHIDELELKLTAPLEEEIEEEMHRFLAERSQSNS